MKVWIVANEVHDGWNGYSIQLIEVFVNKDAAEAKAFARRNASPSDVSVVLLEVQTKDELESSNDSL